MGSGFISTAGKVQIGDLPIRKNAEGVHAFGREVDPAAFGCSGGEKEVLNMNKI